ncbi:phenylalanine--tRNA ligase subunit alpha [Solirubrum puertoriconensis]|uniref:Phenylalanine--tRNA ligase alpha subunit n=1 Tax=Solirubrum puertoriconensis TaxID=1751427 RepID=A0A9X0HLF9_SOLP1|nr:phenylalanine--tRNA ligase subunit alpha [Solirubrum puertoriconensis]KUG07979.1 phenylalanine--tRNA ligase subunit alpha [Solirubrum puertoriconensis]
MQDTIQQLREEIEAYDVSTAQQLDQFRIAYTGRKGRLADLFDQLKTVAAEDRRAVGQQLNQLKQLAQDKFDQRRQQLEDEAASQPADPGYDYTLPPVPGALGTRHPLSLTRDEIVRIFSRIGFNVAEGPEIEDDWHNFSALNFPENHPAREMQDTFFVPAAGEEEQNRLLRTHTSTVQVRLMQSQKPPIRSIMPGRVYRNEAISARAHMVFHQIEGLYIDENVSFADLKQTIYYFAQEFYGKDVKMRMRPSYFPFTEPSTEIDISCLICKGAGCNICKYTGWVEIMGAGMVDPNVLRNCGIDPERYSGFAFGMGLERPTMLKYQIKDLRLFTQNDMRFLRQFEAIH